MVQFQSSSDSGKSSNNDSSSDMLSEGPGVNDIGAANTEFEDPDAMIQCQSFVFYY